MPVEIDIDEKCVTAYISGEIDHHNAAGLRNKIDAAVENAYPELLILDFGGVTFMDSSGIAVVINALRQMNKIEGKLILTGIQSQPRKVFRASGLDKLVEIKEAVV